MPIVLQVPDSALIPPDRPLEAQCPCCKKWHKEIGWNQCPKCRMESDLDFYQRNMVPSDAPDDEETDRKD